MYFCFWFYLDIVFDGVNHLVAHQPANRISKIAHQERFSFNQHYFRHYSLEEKPFELHLKRNKEHHFENKQTNKFDMSNIESRGSSLKLDSIAHQKERVQCRIQYFGLLGK